MERSVEKTRNFPIGNITTVELLCSVGVFFVAITVLATTTANDRVGVLDGTREWTQQYGHQRPAGSPYRRPLQDDLAIGEPVETSGRLLESPYRVGNVESTSSLLPPRVPEITAHPVEDHSLSESRGKPAYTADARYGESEVVVYYDDFQVDTCNSSSDSVSTQVEYQYRPVFNNQLWARSEYLLWWTQGLDVPPLVTTSPLGTDPGVAGVLGQPGTAILFGGDKIEYNSQPGGRFTLGYWIRPCREMSFDLSYLFLEQTSLGYRATTPVDTHGRPCVPQT